jgi:hypothetical protein
VQLRDMKRQEYEGKFINMVCKFIPSYAITLKEYEGISSTHS